MPAQIYQTQPVAQGQTTNRVLAIRPRRRSLNAAQQPPKVPHDASTMGTPDVPLQTGVAAKVKGDSTNRGTDEGNQKVESVPEQSSNNAELSQYRGSDKDSVVIVDFINEDPRMPENSLFMVSVPPDGGIFPGSFQLLSGDRFKCDSLSMSFFRGGKQSVITANGPSRDESALDLALVTDHTALPELPPPSCLSMSSQQTGGSQETVPGASAKST